MIYGLRRQLSSKEDDCIKVADSSASFHFFIFLYFVFFLLFVNGLWLCLDRRRPLKIRPATWPGHHSGGSQQSASWPTFILPNDSLIIILLGAASTSVAAADYSLFFVRVQRTHTKTAVQEFSMPQNFCRVFLISYFTLLFLFFFLGHFVKHSRHAASF